MVERIKTVVANDWYKEQVEYDVIRETEKYYVVEYTNEFTEKEWKVSKQDAMVVPVFNHVVLYSETFYGDERVHDLIFRTLAKDEAHARKLIKKTYPNSSVVNVSRDISKDRAEGRI